MTNSAPTTNGFSSYNTVPETLLGINNNPLTYGVLVLNRPVRNPVNFLIPFWNQAAIRVTVDGGTNRWLSYLDHHKLSTTNLKTIDIAVGDFDSIEKESLQRAELQKAEIIHTPDQNETDFTKALRELSVYSTRKKIILDAVFVLCQTSGRLDQIMANINTLYKFLKENLLNNVPIYLLSDDSLSWLLSPGENLIKIPESLLNNKKSWCAVIPLGESCKNVSTSGLRWNLKDSTLEFGQIVSTSNTFDGSSSVRINATNILLWSMNILPWFSTLYGVSDEES